MDTTQLVRASAEVVTITSFKPGDVYKRVETDYSGATSLRFGVVQDVMNNGSDAAFTAIEYRPEWNSVVVDLKVYDGTRPAALYAATPEEVQHHLSELLEVSQRRVNEATDALTKATEARDRVLEVMRRVDGSGLTAPDTAAGILDVPSGHTGSPGGSHEPITGPDGPTDDSNFDD